MAAGDYWAMIGAFGQIAGSVATFAAVALSLWIVLSERRPDLRLSVQLLNYYPPLPNGVEQMIGFAVTNRSNRPITIGSYGWRTGRFRKQQAIINHDQGHHYQPALPCTIPPGQRITFVNDPYVFQGEVGRIPEFFGVELLGRRYVRRIMGAVHTMDGFTKKVKVDRHVLKMVKDRLRLMAEPSGQP